MCNEGMAAMGGLSEIVDSLEGRLDELYKKMLELQKQNSELESKISRSEAAMKKQSDEIAALQQQNESLRIANSLLGSDDNKRETKLKINSLIREIDFCIAQLSE
ncbi:hypothetical protein [Flavobacterium rhizosphaerae]|uniref:Cell division protein ZapB n=1 Tax=Flavobacterium rhizosphaerae TaxID=3163298 RepID=A0ABW8YV28_9FLAO